jgi:predicted regulator of Ras-like GTPase activity (Roadblock/LC7/MglB family)
MAGTLTPERTAERLCELSADARAAVLLDAAGSPAGSHGVTAKHSRDLGELAAELFAAVDRAHRDIPGGPPEQVEVQVEGGAVYASRTPQWTLVVVARRAALSSLMLMDLRAVLGELEGGPPIRRSAAAGEAEPGEPGGPATEEEAAGESPIPELGRDAP